MKRIAVLCIIILSLTACGHKNAEKRYDDVKLAPPVVKADKDEKEDEPAIEKQLEVADPGQKSQKGDPGPITEAADPVPTNKSSAYTVADTAKKIIKQGDISFETADVTTTRHRILHALQKLGGYVYDDSQSLNTDENRQEYTLKIRIPAKSFDLFLDSVTSGVKQIDTKDISILDVTTRYIDMATRLAHKKLLEARYIQLLKQASKMADILAVEDKLNDIRTDIETTQGNLNYLNKQVAYSSLDITFYSKAKAAQSQSNSSVYQFKRALNRGWAWVKRLFFDGIACWPIVLVVIIGFTLFKKRKGNKSIEDAE